MREAGDDAEVWLTDDRGIFLRTDISCKALAHKLSAHASLHAHLLKCENVYYYVWNRNH